MQSGSRRLYTPLFGILLAACMVRFWLFLLPESFWLDETVTAFVLRHGAGHPSLAAGPRLDQTVYYLLPRVSQALLGFSEFSLRLPSFLATCVSLLLIGRLAARFIHPAAAWFAVFLCFVPHEFTRQATDARPYGLGTCVALCAVWWLVRWLDTDRWPHAALFALSAALLLRVHLIYWPFYAVFLLYAAVRKRSGETPVQGKRIALVMGAVALSLAPMVPVTLSLFGEAKDHIVVPPPGWTLAIGGFQFRLVAMFAAAAWVLAKLLRWPRERDAVALPTAALLLAWWLWQPLCLLAASLATGNSVFVPRYFSVSIPGLVLTCTLAVGYAMPARFWKPAAALLAVGVLIVSFGKDPFPPTRNSQWREAAQAVNGVVGNSGIPVICPSPFVEARSPAWNQAYALPGFLYAHLDAYPVRGEKYLLPARAEQPGQTYARNLVASRLPQAGRFVIYGGTFAVSLWTDWFAAQPEFAHWHNFQVGRFGEVEIVEFVPNQ